MNSLQEASINQQAAEAQRKIEAISVRLLNTFDSTSVIKDLNEISATITNLTNLIRVLHEAALEARSSRSSRRR